MSFQFSRTPTPLLKAMHSTADKRLGEEIQRMARADVGFSWALYEAMEIDSELERRGVIS